MGPLEIGVIVVFVIIIASALLSPRSPEQPKTSAAAPMSKRQQQQAAVQAHAAVKAAVARTKAAAPTIAMRQMKPMIDQKTGQVVQQQTIAVSQAARMVVAHSLPHTKTMAPSSAAINSRSGVGYKTMVPSSAAAPPVSATPASGNGAQLDSYRRATLVNPRMIQDAKDPEDSRAFRNRIGAPTGVYGTMLGMMKDSQPTAKDTIDCQGVPMLGLDVSHPCFGVINNALLNEDRARIALPVSV